MKTIGRYLANIIVTALLWVSLWWLLDLIPSFDEPLFWEWSIAKFLGLLVAALIVTLNRHKFPWLRLETRK